MEQSVPVPPPRNIGLTPDGYVRPRELPESNDDDYQPLPQRPERPLSDEFEDLPDVPAPPPPRTGRGRSMSTVEPPPQHLLMTDSNKNLDIPPPLPVRPTDLPPVIDMNYPRRGQRKISLPAILYPTHGKKDKPVVSPNTITFTRRVGAINPPNMGQPTQTIPEFVPNDRQGIQRSTGSRHSTQSNSSSSPSGESWKSLDSGRWSETDKQHSLPFDTCTPGKLQQSIKEDEVYSTVSTNEHTQFDNALHSYSWFHHDTTDRHVSNERLVTKNVDGAFLIRPRDGNNTKEPYAMHIFQKSNRKIHILKLRQRSDALFALGTEKPAEKAFTSLAELVEFHRNNPLRLEGFENDGIYLSESPKKPPKSSKS